MVYGVAWWVYCEVKLATQFTVVLVQRNMHACVLLEKPVGDAQRIRICASSGGRVNTIALVDCSIKLCFYMDIYKFEKEQGRGNNNTSRGCLDWLISKGFQRTCLFHVSFL